VLGQDELGREVCRRLAAAGKRVSALWGVEHDPELHDPLLSHVFGDPRRSAVLIRAGAKVAGTILAITPDDQLNLRVALAARDLNPHIRIVLRQFNRWLGRKIVANLRDSEAVSPETFSAATFAASCLNASVYQAIEFPRYSENLFTFCRANSSEVGCAGWIVREVEQRKRWHVLAIDDRCFPEKDARIPAGATLVVACALDNAPRSENPPGRSEQRAMVPRQRVSLWHCIVRKRYDPVLLAMVLALVGILTFATFFFHNELGLRLYDAFYFVMTTATTTGFGDVTLLQRSDAAKAVGMLVMFLGIAITGTLLAFLTAAITRRSFEFAQGRHAVSGRGHIVVCGFGNVGARVAQYLIRAGQRVVVIDRKPDDSLSTELRALGVHVMTADATSESAQELARVAQASALLALTDSDSANLEVALTALAYAPDMPVIMRIADPGTAKAVERHFRIRASYSSAALAAPLVAGLALETGSRGMIDIAGKPYALAQRPCGFALLPHELILAADGEVELILRLVR
jgi:Trk K+ transport system NAD-binding subunit